MRLSHGQRAHRLFSSISLHKYRSSQTQTSLMSGADKAAAKGSLALHRLSSSTSFYSCVSFDDTGEEHPQITASVEILSASPDHVSISVNLDGENDNSMNDAKLQQANIVRMVKEEDLDSIHKFGHDEDLESPLLVSNQSEEQNVISGADKLAVKDSRAFHRLSSPKESFHSIISFNDDTADKAAEKGSRDFHRLSSSTSFHSCTGFEDSSIDETGEEHPQITASVEIVSASPHVSINVNLDGENENSINDAKLQEANIARMVKEKDLDSIQKFGGIKGISEALDTDLETGIRHSTHRASTHSTTQSTPERGFFKFLLKYCSNCIIFLLFVSAVLSLGFGIEEEGLRTGWYEGVIIIIAIVILVAAPSLRDFWLEHSWKMSGKHKPLEVDVLIGGHPQKVHMGDVLVGDIVCLERETLIPADGLFISGDQLLKLNDGLESTIDDRNPFLFYGAKVVDGSGRMLVTSVGMDTTRSQLMGRVIHPRHKTSLPAELDRVSIRTQIIGLSISILILVVLFLRFKFKKELDVGSNLPELKGKPIGSEEIIDATMRFVVELNGKTRTLTTSLTILLVGVTEGIPFVVALTIDYWNKKMLSDKAVAQEPLACLTMASVTTICIDKTGWPTLDPSADEVCRTETRNAIEGWKKNGVNIILVSEDDVSVLEDIALRFGLLANSKRSSALEGEQFQNYSNEERMNEVDKIMVMGSSFPSHRLLLVQCLKKKGHKVAMVGVKTNEIPALKEADVCIVMGICSSEMDRENSDIIIRDGNISFLVTIVSCGRCTYDNIRKYIQLVLTMNIAGWLITLITTICFGYSPITAIQLLWANFFVTLLGGFALLTEPTTEKLMEKPPMIRQSEPLITKAMWRNLVSQALYQVATLVTIQFKGEAIKGISEDVCKTIIFNTFFLCQVFNQVNARELERKNVFRDIHSNPWFLVAVILIVGLQVAFIEIAHFFVGNARLNWVQWFVCLLIGMVSWAIDWATKYTSGCIMDCFDGSHMGTIGTTPSDPSESATLELPLMNENLTPVSS